MTQYRLTYFDFDGGRGEPIRIAFLKVLALVRSLTSGNLEHVPVDLVERVAAGLVRHKDAVTAHPVVSSYYESRNGAN